MLKEENVLLTFLGGFFEKYINTSVFVYILFIFPFQSERMRASEVLKGPEVTKYSGDKKEFIEDIRKALYASKIVSYAQGFMLLREAANVFKWKLNYGGIGKERDKDTLFPPFFVKFLQYLKWHKWFFFFLNYATK